MNKDDKIWQEAQMYCNSSNMPVWIGRKNAVLTYFSPLLTQSEFDSAIDGYVMIIKLNPYSLFQDRDQRISK